GRASFPIWKSLWTEFQDKILAVIKRRELVRGLITSLKIFLHSWEVYCYHTAVFLFHH
ncbi:hypothetical protein ILYODFUR_034174, partial [Ilyodon furcidens]